jgi:hypothetical protein
MQSESWKKATEVNFYTGNPQIILKSGAFTFHDSLAEDDPAPSRFLFILNVPDDMDLGEIFEFFEEYKTDILEGRVFKTSLTSCYGILLKIFSPETALTIYNKYNEKPFSFIEQKECIIKWIKTLEIFNESSSNEDSPSLRKISQKLSLEIFFSYYDEKFLASPPRGNRKNSSSLNNNSTTTKSASKKDKKNLNQDFCPIC